MIAMEGNEAATVSTRLMYRAVTRGQDLLAWWPFDEDVIGTATVTGKTINTRTANLYNGAQVSSLASLVTGLSLIERSTGSRMTIMTEKRLAWVITGLFLPG